MKSNNLLVSNCCSPLAIRFELCRLNGDDKSLVPRKWCQDVITWILVGVVATKGTQGNLKNSLHDLGI